jgi:hypothetical protein
MHRESFSYDPTYLGEPLPIITVEFHKHVGSLEQVLGRVIADTGANASTLPWSGCEQVVRQYS